MARKRHSDEDILKLLREVEVHLASGSDVGTACRTAGISDATYYNWKTKYGGMEIADIRKLKELTDENRRLKKMYAEERLKAEILKEAIEKKW